MYILTFGSDPDPDCGSDRIHFGGGLRSPSAFVSQTGMRQSPRYN